MTTCRDPRGARLRRRPRARSRRRPGPWKDEHPVRLRLAFAPPQGGRSIHFLGHLRMMSAVQPFLSRRPSRRRATCPSNEATIADIKGAHLEGWRLGLKALAIYRDGSKGSQPVSTKSDSRATPPSKRPAPLAAPTRWPRLRPRSPPRPPCRSPPLPVAAWRCSRGRERLPFTRRSLTHKFDIQGHEGYVTVGFYPDGRVGEMFITMAKEGSTIGGLMDVVGTSISIGLQYGVPLEVFVNKFAHEDPVRAGRGHQEPGHPDRQERDGLHLTLAGPRVHPRLPRGEHRPAPPGRRGRGSRRARSPRR